MHSAFTAYRVGNSNAYLAYSMGQILNDLQWPADKQILFSQWAADEQVLFSPDRLSYFPQTSLVVDNLRGIEHLTVWAVNLN